MIFCFIFITSSAQPGRNEISVGISGGISALHYSVSEGKFKPQGGASLNLGYLLKITDLWGIGTGTELSLYRSKVNIDRYSDNYTVLSNSIPDGSSEQYIRFQIYLYQFSRRAKSPLSEYSHIFPVTIRQPFGNIRKSRYKNRDTNNSNPQ